MKYDLHIGSRPDTTESVEEKHAKFIEGLLSLGHPWGIIESPQVPTKKLRVEGAPLSRLLGKSIGGFVGYSGRVVWDDRAVNDDSIKIFFNPEKVHYENLLNKALKIYIESFSAYSVSCTHHDYYIWNENDVEKGPLLIKDPRHGVDRFGPINFFDDLLCQRAFNMNCEQLQTTINDIVAHTELFAGGILVYLSLSPMTFEQIVVADKVIQARLKSDMPSD